MNLTTFENRPEYQHKVQIKAKKVLASKSSFNVNARNTDMANYPKPVNRVQSFRNKLKTNSFVTMKNQYKTSYKSPYKIKKETHHIDFVTDLFRDEEET